MNNPADVRILTTGQLPQLPGQLEPGDKFCYDEPVVKFATSGVGIDERFGRVITVGPFEVVEREGNSLVVQTEYEGAVWVTKFPINRRCLMTT